MKQRRNNFLEGAILPSLLKFAVPVLLALVLQALYGAVDLWAVGKFGTTADISAVSTGSQTMQIVTGIVTGLSMGTTVLLGQRIGHKDDEGSALTVGTSIKVFSILGITLSFVMVLAAKPIAHWMNAPKEAFTQTVHYIQICGGGSLCIVAYNLLSAVFRGMGDSKSPLIRSAASFSFAVCQALCAASRSFSSCSSLSFLNDHACVVHPSNCHDTAEKPYSPHSRSPRRACDPRCAHCLYGRWAADLRRALAHRYYWRCVAECWACYVICVRYEKARKVEKEFSCLCIMKEKVREGICNQKIKSSSGDSDRTI